MHIKYNNLAHEYFGEDKLSEAALHKAIKAAINLEDGRKQGKSAELVVKYCDSLMKKYTGDMVTLGEQFDKSLVVLQFLEDKEIFKHFYCKRLAGRLLRHQNQNFKVEHVMIDKMQQAYQYQPTVDFCRSRQNARSTIN